jgi:peptidoglycan L-alanyl-D-glutamate endopeptidase CwlK
MGFEFSTTSQRKLDTCENDLRIVLENTLALGVIDISVLEGVRERRLQDIYFKDGVSKLRWPESKHNVLTRIDKSRAVDIAPYVRGKLSFDIGHCCFLAGLILATAKHLGISIRWGGNWDMDGEPITDQGFNDLVHYELI